MRTYSRQIQSKKRRRSEEQNEAKLMLKEMRSCFEVKGIQHQENLVGNKLALEVMPDRVVNKIREFTGDESIYRVSRQMWWKKNRLRGGEERKVRGIEEIILAKFVLEFIENKQKKAVMRVSRLVFGNVTAVSIQKGQSSMGSFDELPPEVENNTYQIFN